MTKKGKFLSRLKKNKPLRVIANLALGVLNGIPGVSNFTPSVQNFNENIDDADFNQDGKIGEVKKGELIVYYTISNLGLIIGVLIVLLAALTLVPKENVEWALEILNKF